MVTGRSKKPPDSSQVLHENDVSRCSLIQEPSFALVLALSAQTVDRSNCARYDGNSSNNVRTIHWTSVALASGFASVPPQRRPGAMKGAKTKQLSRLRGALSLGITGA